MFWAGSYNRSADPLKKSSPALACRGHPRRFGAHSLSESFVPSASPHPWDTRTPHFLPAFSSLDCQSYQTTVSGAGMCDSREDKEIQSIRFEQHSEKYSTCPSGFSLSDILAYTFLLYSLIYLIISCFNLLFVRIETLFAGSIINLLL